MLFLFLGSELILFLAPLAPRESDHLRGRPYTDSFVNLTEAAIDFPAHLQVVSMMLVGCHETTIRLDYLGISHSASVLLW